MFSTIKLLRSNSFFKLVAVLLFALINITGSDDPKPKQKRILWFKSDGKLALPAGATITILPSFEFPIMKNPPKSGFNIGFGITTPIKIEFDKLGLTDKMNPFGTIPYTHMVMSRSAKSMAGIAAKLNDYVSNMIEHTRKRRDTSEAPELPTQYKDAFHAGERALLYMTAQEFLEKFGFNGKGCLLRAICEVHAHPLHQFGLLGEMLRLFLTASKSSYSHLLDEYVAAENTGSGRTGPAECWPYYKNCTTSLFVQNHNKYSEHHDLSTNEVDTDQHNKYSKYTNDFLFDKHNKYSKYDYHKNDMDIDDVHNNRLEKRDLYNSADTASDFTFM